MMGDTYSIAWSPDSAFIAGVSPKKNISLWTSATGTKLFSLDSQDALGLNWSPDGKILASRRWDGVTLWFVGSVLP
jgi:WD40 repeat protein